LLTGSFMIIAGSLRGFGGGVITYTRDGFSDSHCVQRTMTPNVASIQPGASKLSKRTLLLEWCCCSWSVCLLLPFLPIIILCVCVFLSVLSDSSQIVYTHCKRKKKERKSLCRDFISSGGEVKNGVKQHTKINKNQQQSTLTTTTATSTTTPPTTNNNHHHHHHHHHAGCCSSSCGCVQGFLDCLWWSYMKTRTIHRS